MNNPGRVSRCKIFPLESERLVTATYRKKKKRKLFTHTRTRARTCVVAGNGGRGEAVGGASVCGSRGTVC